VTGTRELRASLFWWLAAFSILSAAFLSGVLRSQALPVWIGDYPSRPVNERPHFDRSSEFLVENMIDIRLLGVAPPPGGFMFRIEPDPRMLDVDRLRAYDGYWVPKASDLSRQSVYKSQFGLQGRVYPAAAEALELRRQDAVQLLQSANALLLAAMLATILLLFRKEWGAAAALSALAFCVFSTGFNLFAPSLYWITFVHVAPAAILSLAILGGAHRRLAWLGAYSLVFVLFAIKLSSGYEFMTATVGGAVLPFLVSYGAGRIGWRALLVHAAALNAVGLAAFAVCLAAYNLHFQATFGESGIAYLLSRSDEWGAPAVQSAVDLLRNFSKVLLINFVDVGGYGLPNALPLAAGGLFVLLGVRALFLRLTEEASSRLFLAIAGGFLISIAWAALQPQHILFHPRYSSILMSYPFGLLLVAGMVRLLQLARARRRLPS
jgi:hypothetical protein